MECVPIMFTTKSKRSFAIIHLPHTLPLSLSLSLTISLSLSFFLSLPCMQGFPLNIGVSSYEQIAPTQQAKLVAHKNSKVIKFKNEG